MKFTGECRLLVPAKFAQSEAYHRLRHPDTHQSPALAGAHALFF